MLLSLFVATAFTFSLFFPQYSLICLILVTQFLLKARHWQKFIFFISHALFFYTPIILWLFNDVLDHQADIIICFSFLISIVSLILIILFITMKKINRLFNQNIFIIIIENTLLYFFLYHIVGHFYSPGIISPNFYPLTGLAWFGRLGLPYFHQRYCWLYFVIFQLCIHIILRNKVFFSIGTAYILYLTFFYQKDLVEYYWLKETGQSWEQYIYKDKFIFPENMFFIENEEVIKKLSELAKTTKKEVIGGISWETIDKGHLLSKHGAIIISADGNVKIREKKHYLPFTETKNKEYQINLTREPSPPVLICSELFLSNLDKLLLDKIFIASIMWTKTPYTWFYKNFMIVLYDLHQLL